MTIEVLRNATDAQIDRINEIEALCSDYERAIAELRAEEAQILNDMEGVE